MHRKRIPKGFKNNPKRFCEYMKKLQTVKDVVTALKKEDGEMTPTEQQWLMSWPNPFRRCLQDEIGISQSTENQHSRLQTMNNTTIDLSSDSVLDKLQNLRSDKSLGPDGLHPMFLKSCASAMADPLSIIFRSSLASGQVPDDWKMANTVLICKKRIQLRPSKL